MRKPLLALVLLAMSDMLVTAALGGIGEAVLPSWAPKHPSQEFLHAAKVLKPIPEEAQPYLPMYLPTWELFGSLTDQQVKQFLTRRQVSVSLGEVRPSVKKYIIEKEHGKPVGDKLVWDTREIWVRAKSFSPRQRALFDFLVNAWREEHKGAPEEDLLVLLYKWGAKRDLSNAGIAFSIQGGHAVNIII
jgi:hypothetical protein